MALAGCHERATPEACRAILDRIVELELHEMGYSDPVLAARKRAELEKKLAPELERCHGLRLPADALQCVRRATSAEELTHRCLP
jgi:hypothetical protein